jgi:predicted amidohydrolase
VLGFLERRGDLLFNSAVLIDPDGDLIGRYSKTHFAQGYEVNPVFYRAGDEYPVFATPFGPVGIIICYDRQPPEPARIMAVKGARLLLIPSYGSYDNWSGWNTALMRSRAYENNFPLVFCNPFQSLLITAGGEIKAMGGAGEIVYYEINTDPERYERRFRNRRPPTYTPLIEGADPARKIE